MDQRLCDDMCNLQVGGRSAAMEPASAKTLLNFLKSYGVKIDFFATDRSTTIKYGFLSCGLIL
jgi:hypothetical protein